MDTKPLSRCLPDGMTLTVLEETGSTNRLLLEAAYAGEGETLLIAESQSEGRGRFDRRFFSPPGTGIYMSLLLYPDFDFSLYPLLTPLCGVAVAEAAEAVSDRHAEIKWVNDIYADGKKLAGILAEAGRSHAPFVVLGIGVNAYTPSHIPEELKGKMISLWGEKGKTDERERFVCAFLERFFHYYSMLPKRDFMAEYRRRSLLIGKKVRVHNAAFDTAKTGEGTEALCLGVDEDGALLVLYENGESACLTAGEVTLSL